MAYVYIVECSDSSYYTGWAANLEKRIETHNAGKGAKYTKARRPVKLIWWQSYDTPSQAMQIEAAIKRLTRSEKELFIKGELVLSKEVEINGREVSEDSCS